MESETVYLLWNQPFFVRLRTACQSAYSYLLVPISTCQVARSVTSSSYLFGEVKEIKNPCWILCLDLKS